MSLVVAFDVYGTLVDPWSLRQPLSAYVGAENADKAAGLWRTTQVEYAFRRGLMKRYADFDTCTREALLFTLRSLRITPTQSAVDDLLAAYLRLPAFEDARDAIGDVRALGARIVAFSNGTAESVRLVLENAGVVHLLDDVVSVDEIGSFKPDPAVYRHLISRCESPPESIWLVSANAWDVIGATAAGLRSIWVRRHDGPFDPWGIDPDAVVAALSEAAPAIRNASSGDTSGDRADATG